MFPPVQRTPSVGDQQFRRARRARPIWHDKPETARRVRQRIGAVMQWAVTMEYRADNPCDRVAATLGRQRDVVRHIRTLPHAEVASAMATARASRATATAKLAFEFLVLTAARSGEVRLARWEKIDLEADVWTVPNRAHEGEPRARGVAVAGGREPPRDGTEVAQLERPRVSKPPRQTSLRPDSVQAAQRAVHPAVRHGFRSRVRE